MTNLLLACNQAPGHSRLQRPRSFYGSTKNRILWEGPIFWAYAGNWFRLWERDWMGTILLFQNGCSQSSRFPTGCWSSGTKTLGTRLAPLARVLLSWRRSSESERRSRDGLARTRISSGHEEKKCSATKHGSLSNPA